MNVHELIKTCKQQGTVSLRQLIPGRGKIQAERRSALKALFGEKDGGVRWDKQRGLYVADQEVS